MGLHAQQAPLNFDANGNLFVNVAAGGGAGGTSSTFGAAFPGTGTAAGFKDSGGTLMQPGNLDSGGNILVNCASGCSGAADTVGSGNLTALNSAVSIAMAGVNSASFTLPAANTLVGTITPEVSNDGGTTWIATNLRQNSISSSNFWQATLAANSTAGSWEIEIPGGASNVRIRVSAYTSGSATAAKVRGTQQPELVLGSMGVAGQAIPPYVTVLGGSDGTNARALSTNSSGQLNVLQAAANWTINLAQLAGTATDTNSGNKSAGTLRVVIATDQPALTNALKVDGSGVTQPISGTVTANEGGSPWAINVSQLGGNAINTGNGTTGTGTLRVTLSSDSTGTVAATESGTWTVQPGNTANTTPWLVQGNLTDNGAAESGNRIGTLPGAAQTDYANGSANTQGRNVGLDVGTDGLLWTANLPALRPASYHAAKNFAASSTTDNACIYGNGTDTVLLYEVRLSGIQTTAGQVDVELVRRSAAETGGTSANFTVVRDDVTNYAAASTTPVSYTGTGPTAGAAVGDIDDQYVGFMASATASPNDIYIWNGKLKPQVLIGTTQGICVALGGAVTGGNISMSFGWLEIKNISE